jgi:hypothetical protein
MNLRGWAHALEGIRGKMAATIGDIQNQEANLKSQINSINSMIASLQSQIIADRNAIAEAKAEETKGIVETIFGIILAPFTGGLSLILAGIGVSSIVEAESKVAALEGTIRDYQSRIVTDHQNLTKDQVQVATLNGLTLSAGVALNDLDVAERMLDIVRTNWAAFFQEMEDVITKISSAQNPEVVILQKAWFNSACEEWDLIVTGTNGLIGTARSSRNVSCDVPVIRIVPTESHPPMSSDLKVVSLVDPNDPRPVSTCPILTWKDYSYWVASYTNNRLAMCILIFDKSNTIIKQLDKPGARYLWKMTLDQEKKLLTCYGQSNNEVVATFEELQIT